MSEMVERVARAIDPVGWAWYDRASAVHVAKRQFFAEAMHAARNAIMAMREPTEAMRQAGCMWIDDGPEEAADVYRAMIGAAVAP